jgi:hypothetical protein
MKQLCDDDNLTGQTVVDLARPVGSALHSHFTWDDAVAGEMHRVEEARSLIASVRIEITVSDVVFLAPQYVRDVTLAGDQAGYCDLNSVRKSKNRSVGTAIMELTAAIRCLERARIVSLALKVKPELDALVASAREVLGQLGR